MNRKSKLKINKGEEFKIAIKDIKDGDTIFYDQYKQALKMLGTIVKTSEIIQENIVVQLSRQKSKLFIMN